MTVNEHTAAECEVYEPTSVGAKLVPEGPNIALEEARGMLAYLTPELMSELADAVLRRLDDESATVVLLTRLCRAAPETWAVVAEQLTQLLAQRHNKALEALAEADALQRDADVIRCNALEEKRAAEVCALTVLRAVPTQLAARLFGAQLRNVAEAE